MAYYAMRMQILSQYHAPIVFARQALYKAPGKIDFLLLGKPIVNMMVQIHEKGHMHI
jgi:hypothetical protein